MKRINSNVYTRGNFGKNPRETVDTDNEFLYFHGIYPTKIKKEDLPESYVEIRSRVIWYMLGYVKTADVVDIDYIPLKINHLFKDDYMYISYKDKLSYKNNRYGFMEVTNYDVCICGNSIIPVLLGIEKYSNIDTSKVREKIENKFNWWKTNYPEDCSSSIKTIDDIYEKYK